MSEESTGGDLHPGFNATPAPAENVTADRSQAENPRTRGHSPARDSREQQAPPPERMIRVGETDFAEKQVTDALAFRAEQDVRERSLPPSADKYEIKLPPNFKAPEGVKFDFDLTDPLLQSARQGRIRGGGLPICAEKFAEGYWRARQPQPPCAITPAEQEYLNAVGRAALTQTIAG